MAFRFPKSINDIQQGVVLSESFYRMRLVKEPSIEQNRKMKNGLSPEEGAGMNLVLQLRIVSDDPNENGREFTKYLPMPRPGIDENEFDRFTGQSLMDRKMEAIVHWVLAFDGEIHDDEFDLRAGSEAAVKIVIEDRDGKKTNAISMNDIPQLL
jgi:hypothetical protein